MPIFAMLIRPGEGGIQRWDMEAATADEAFAAACDRSTRMDRLSASACDLPFDAEAHRASFSMLVSIPYEEGDEKPYIDVAAYRQNVHRHEESPDEPTVPAPGF